MATTATTRRGRTPFRLTEADCRLEDFAALVDHTTELVDYPNPVEVQLDVVVYDCAALRTATSASCPTRSRRATRRTCICCRRCSPLQGAVAHSEMPVESGPTMYLPYSHQYAPGYLAWRRPEFSEFFSRRYVQLPLAKGDAVFVNPALFHGAENNTSADVQRMANLLQVRSAFRPGDGNRRPGEDGEVRVPDTAGPSRGRPRPSESLTDAINCAAEGYPFPSNLDLDENVGGLTPPERRPLCSSRH